MRPHFVEVKFYIHITTEPQLRGGGTNAPCEITLEMLKEAVDIISSDSLPSLSDVSARETMEKIVKIKHF